MIGDVQRASTNPYATNHTLVRLHETQNWLQNNLNFTLLLTIEGTIGREVIIVSF